jgi:hypothetical protein
LSLTEQVLFETMMCFDNKKKVWSMYFLHCATLSKNPWNSQNKISIDTDLLIMINLITNNTLVLLEVYFINLNLFFSFVIQNLIDITWIQFKVWGGGGPIRLIITFFGWLPFKEKKKKFLDSLKCRPSFFCTTCMNEDPGVEAHVTNWTNN